MKLKYKFVTHTIGGTVVAAAVGRGASEFHGMLQMSETGKAALEMLKEDISQEELVQKMLERFDGDEALIRQETEAFCEKLMEAGILE